MRKLISRPTNVILEQVQLLRFKYNILKTTNLQEALRYSPLQLHRISPKILTHELPGPRFRNTHTPGVVVDGDWDLNTINCDREHFKGFQQRFIEGKSWEDTILFQDAINRTAGNYWHGCKSRSEIIDRLLEYDKIFESIENCGYKTQRELAEKADAVGAHRFRLRPPELREIIVHIGRDGNYIFDDGRHRLAIAKILELSSIPVMVIARHRQWYEKQLQDKQIG